MISLYGIYKNLITLLYKKTVTESDSALSRTKADADAYRQTQSENVTAMVANALAVYTLADSDISIEGDNSRAALLSEISARHFDTLKARVADCLGTGLLASVPCTHTVGTRRKIFIDSVPKDRFFITGMSGDEISACTVVSDVRVREGRTYVRLTDYTLSGDTYIIRVRAARDGAPCPLSTLPDWAGIPEEIRIAGVDRLPIGIMRCPTSNRRPENPDGVPVTYGCGKTMKKITDTLEQIEKEYEGKAVRLFVHEDMFGEKDKLSDLYKKISGDDMNFFEIFSPEIRNSSYFEKLKFHFGMLEREIGCSGGILTELETGTATATEIRAKMYKTFALCTDIQKAIERYYDDLMYGCDVLASFFGLTPDGEYNIKYDWSYGLLEDSATTYLQYKEGAADGVIKKAEYRSFITGESPEEAQAAIDEIEEKEPALDKLFAGMDQPIPPREANTVKAEKTEQTQETERE